MTGDGDLYAIKERVESHERRITEHGKEIDELKISEATMGVTLSRIDQTVGKIDAKLEASEQRPGRRWETVTSQLIAIIVAAIMALVLAKIGLSPVP